MKKELNFSFGKNIKESWRLYKRNFWDLLIINIILVAVLYAVNLLDKSKVGTSSVEIFNLNNFSLNFSLPQSIVSLVVFSFLVSFILKFSLDIVEKEKIRLFSREIKNLIPSFKVYLNALLAIVICSIIMGVGMILLIIPGLYLMGRLFPVFYLIVDKKINVFKAIKMSWEITRKTGWYLFWKQVQVILFSLIPFLLIVLVLITIFSVSFVKSFFITGLFLVPIITLIAYIISALLNAPIGMILLAKLYSEMVSEGERLEPAKQEVEESFVDQIVA
jgi:membrane-anchored glycerophosphoryl diester phosphodiesterase (GDPDase)